MEWRRSGKSIGGIGAVSTRSEDEVFSDAATEFQDSGFDSGADNTTLADKFAEKDLNSNISFKDCEDNDFLQSPRNSADRSQKESPFKISTPIVPMGTPEHHDIDLSNCEDSEDKHGSASDVASIETETLNSVLEESREVGARASAAACCVGQPADVDEIKESKLNENLSSDSVQHRKHADKISETESILEKRPDVTSDMVQLKEEFSDMLSSKTSMSRNGEQETDEKGDSALVERPQMGRNEQEIDGKGDSALGERSSMSTNGEQHTDPSIKFDNTEDLTSETGLAGKIVELEEKSDKLALVDDLSTKAESAKDINVPTDMFEIQTDGMDSSVDVDSNEVNDKKEQQSVYVLSIPDDVPVVDDAETKLKGFKDHNRVKLPQSEVLVSEGIILDREDKVKYRVSQEKFDTVMSNPMAEDIIVVDIYKFGGNSEATVKEELAVGNADVIHIDKGSGALSPVDADTTENEKDREVGSLKEQQPVYVADDLHQTGSLGSRINGVPNVRLMVTHADVEAGELNSVAGDESFAKNMGTLRESTDSSSLSHTNPASNFHEVEGSDDIRARQTEKCNINELETGNGLGEGQVSIKTDSTSKSISTHHQFAIVAEEVNETGGLQSDTVSSSQDDKKESKTSSIHGECAVEDLVASSVDNSERNELQRSIHPLKSELIHSSAVSDSHTKESRAAASQASAVILQGETDNGSFNPQLDTTVGDVLIEISSRADSLEGHWGSNSVLSTQSDNQAAIDSETLPSTGSQALSEAEKAIKLKLASGEQHLDKSDEFEPPSFMTLVERGDSDQTAVAAPETLTAENPRAGWFPSLTHMPNESQGRKKNEEIIEKVANWNANQHGPLKNLTNNEPKPKSPNPNPNPNPAVLGARDGAMGTKVNTMVGPETRMPEPTNVEAEKEWDSPARYPSDIKREKRKHKSRPFWVQFACCSSAN